MMHRIFTAWVLLVSSFFSAQAQSNDSTGVRLAVEKFVSAFNSLQWEPFRASFTEDATIFFPDWEEAFRKAGRTDIESAWLQIFPEFKDSINTVRLNIVPKDIRIQLYGQTSIVTFHLGNGEKYLARRTLVLVKTKGEWRIAHLHASVLFPSATK
jgi:ketosteroid isomerase-like protein